MSKAYRELTAWKLGMDLAREAHIACATYTSPQPDDLLRDLRREVARLPEMVADMSARGPEAARAMLVDIRAALRRTETIATLATELGHLRTEQWADADAAAEAFGEAIEAMIRAAGE